MTSDTSKRFRARVWWEGKKLGVSERWVLIKHALVCGRSKVYLTPEDWGDVSILRCQRCGVVQGEVA